MTSSYTGEQEHIKQAYQNQGIDLDKSTWITLRVDDAGFSDICRYVAKYTSHSYRLQYKPSEPESLRQLKQIKRLQKRLALKDHETQEITLKLVADSKQSTSKQPRDSDDVVAVVPTATHTTPIKYEVDDDDAKTFLSLGHGMHKIQYGEYDIHVCYLSHAAPVGLSYNVAIHETITLLTTQGHQQGKLLHAFVEYVMALHQDKDSDILNIYTFNPDCQQWQLRSQRACRPLHSVILPHQTKQKIIDDMTDFLSASSFYYQHGITYKRAYMFYGPPGSGKTSLIQALAGEFERNLCFLQPTHNKMTDEVFKNAMQRVPAKAVIVMEDIDALFDRNRHSLNNGCPLTFSGLLNGIDGIGAADGAVYMMTTNHPERLDPALLRAGRIDLKIEIPAATHEQIINMFLSFYPQESELAHSFAQHFRDRRFSMAALQNHFISHRKHSAQQAANEIDFEMIFDVIHQEEQMYEQEQKKLQEQAQQPPKKDVNNDQNVDQGDDDCGNC